MTRGFGLPHPCTVLHRTADLERMIYGKIMSASVEEHMKNCHEVNYVFS